MNKMIMWRGKQIPLPPLDLTKPEIAHRFEFFRRAFSFITYNGISGDYAEFGCASAKTFRIAANFIRHHKLTSKIKQWAFDSFKGLPPQQDTKDFHPRWLEGEYAMPAQLFEAILAAHGIARENYEIVVGFYENTIGAKADKSPTSLPDDIALAYVDCDLYSSTRDVLYFLTKRLKIGMIIAFDDYYCYANNAISGERLAMLEFLEMHPEWNFVPFQTYNWAGQAFIVETSRSARGIPPNDMAHSATSS